MSKFLKRVVTTTAIAVVGLGATAFEANTAELKIATFMGPKHHLNGVFGKLAEEIGKATGGETTAKLFSSGQLGKGPVQQYKRVLDNVAEISFGIQGYTSSIFPRTMVVAQPGVGTTAPEITKKAWKVFDKYLAVEYTKVKVLGIWANSPPVLMAKNPIHSIDDIKGLKTRALDATNVPQVNSWGAAGLHIPISGVYDALDKGVIDAVYVAINALFTPWRFGEIAKHVTGGMKSPSALFWFAMNKKAWDGLPAKSKKAIDGLTGYDFSVKTATSWSQPDIVALKRAKAGDAGLTYYTLSAAEAAKFDAATDKSVEAFLAAAEKKGIPAREIYAEVTKPLS